MPWEYPHEWRKPLQREGYLDLFARLGAGPLREAVAFEPFGADMGSWLTKIGWVLSPSTTESFHLAPAEGMVSGAVPLVWDRPGARGVFGDEFVLDDTDAAARRVLEAVADDARWDELSTLAGNGCARTTSASWPVCGARRWGWTEAGRATAVGWDASAPARRCLGPPP